MKYNAKKTLTSGIFVITLRTGVFCQIQDFISKMFSVTLSCKVIMKDDTLMMTSAKQGR